VKWEVNATEGVVVAGGNGNGSQTDQLNIPAGIIVDEQQTIYVVDTENHRIVSISEGTRNGMVIAGGHGPGGAPNQLDHPESLVFNSQGDLYVSDWENFRVQMFAKAKGPPSDGNSNYVGNSFRRWTLIYCCFFLLIISIAI
jgi:sugar lactone lactonase YvrE